MNLINVYFEGEFLTEVTNYKEARQAIEEACKLVYCGNPAIVLYEELNQLKSDFITLQEMIAEAPEEDCEIIIANSWNDEAIKISYEGEGY